jgi:quercetin dioxygenase-like cupin family protein
MARKGQIVENPVTGERFRWHLTEADTGGRLVRAEAWVRPGGGVRAEHFHPLSEERFEVLAGRMTLERGGEPHVLLGGDRATVAAGVPHRWCNGGDEELHMFIEVENPSGFEHMIEDAFAGGHMKLLPGAAFARRHAESIRVTSPPVWLQRVVVPPLAWLNDRAVRARAPSAT